MRVQQFPDEGTRHDHPFVDIERQTAHIDLVDEIRRGFSRGDALVDQRKDFCSLMRRDARIGEHLELVGMQMQRLADDERRFRHRIGGAVGEYHSGLDKAADSVAHQIEQRQQLAGLDRIRCFERWLWLCTCTLRGSLLCGNGFRLLRHYFFHRAAALSSWACASTHTLLSARSSDFQNGALVLR